MSDSNPESNNNKSRPPQPNMKVSRGIFGWVVFVLFALMLLMLLRQNITSAQPMGIIELEKMLDAGKVTHLKFRDDAIEGKRELEEDEAEATATLEFIVQYPPEAIDSDLVKNYTDRVKALQPNATVEYERKSTVWMEVLVMYLPWMMIFAFLWFFVLRPMRNAGGGGGMLGNFGRSRHRVTTKEHTSVTFEDVAGIEEAKEEVTEIIEFLRNPRKFQNLGGRIPRGVLLLGEPGCGKTLLAKAIAGEADVPFFSISGSDFVEMFVGVGASRVRDLFKQAKENSPCIIFLDEIDAVGRRRGSGVSSGGHDEREQTLNAILVEMDGFETNDQVIVIAATNRVDVLDPALIRPGRFDRQVAVPVPDVKGRFEILKVHSRKVKMGPDVDLQRLARATPGFSGADLAAVINEAALRATLENKDFVEQEDLEESRDKVRWGRARKNRAIEEKERVATAYHETGHALVQILMQPDSDPVHKVSILPRGPYLGATFSLPEKDRLNQSRKWMLAQLRILCAGRIAEELFRNDVNSGVASDIRQATQIARLMVTEFGMNDDLGFVFFGDDDQENMLGLSTKSYSDETARKIDAEVRKLIDLAYADARRMIDENREKLERVSQALLKYETLDGDEVIKIMRGEEIRRPSIGDLLDEDRSAATEAQAPSVSPTDTPPEIGPGTLPQPG
jgi:cell division protease FtsH